MKIESYACGAWTAGTDDGVEVKNAINGESIGRVSSQGIDFAGMLEHGRKAGGAALRRMTIHDRANMLKALAKYLLDRKEMFYAVSAKTGATRADSWIDIEGGIGTVFAYSGIARRELPNETFAVEGKVERLSASGSFVGRHILTAKHGVSLHINAFNFPCWGMLEKIAPSLIAGVPAIVKPATVSSYLTEAMVREIIASGILPEGALQLLCGRTGDMFDHLNEQDSVTFTGSAATGQMLKSHPNIVANSIPFNMEADSLNCSILGADAAPGTAEFDLFVKGVAQETTVKAGQKCTAIRRAIVPQNHVDAVIEALRARLDKTPVGDPAVEGVRMGSLVGRDQVEDVWQAVDRLADDNEIVHGGQRDFDVLGADCRKGAFFPSTLLYCDQPFQTRRGTFCRSFWSGHNDHALCQMKTKPSNSPGWAAAAWLARWSPRTTTRPRESCSAQRPGTAACWFSTATAPGNPPATVRRWRHWSTVVRAARAAARNSAAAARSSTICNARPCRVRRIH